MKKYFGCELYFARKLKPYQFMALLATFQSLELVAIFQGFGGAEFMMSEVTFEMNLSCQNSHMGGRAWFKYQGSLQILAIFQGFGGYDFIMSEVTFEKNLSLKK